MLPEEKRVCRTIALTFQYRSLDNLEIDELMFYSYSSCDDEGPRIIPEAMKDISSFSRLLFGRAQVGFITYCKMPLKLRCRKDSITYLKGQRIPLKSSLSDDICLPLR